MSVRAAELGALQRATSGTSLALCAGMSRTLRVIGLVVSFAIAAAGLIGGIALLVLAAHWMPSEPHHGQAVDGLDGIGTFFALLAAGGGLVALVLGGLALRSAIRAA